jgi:hypothetical protein
MYYSDAQNSENPSPIWRKLRFVPAILLAVLAAYGLGTHHVLMVALGLLAVLTFQFKAQQAQNPPGANLAAGAVHADGGSFPGKTPESQTRESHRPSVLDGGSMEHHRATHA